MESTREQPKRGGGRADGSQRRWWERDGNEVSAGCHVPSELIMPWHDGHRWHVHRRADKNQGGSGAQPGWWSTAKNGHTRVHNVAIADVRVSDHV